MMTTMNTTARHEGSRLRKFLTCRIHFVFPKSIIVIEGLGKQMSYCDAFRIIGPNKTSSLGQLGHLPGVDFDCSCTDRRQWLILDILIGHGYLYDVKLTTNSNAHR